MGQWLRRDGVAQTLLSVQLGRIERSGHFEPRRLEADAPAGKDAGATFPCSGLMESASFPLFECDPHRFVHEPQPQDGPAAVPRHEMTGERSYDAARSSR
jgi:hypothetical protein